MAREHGLAPRLIGRNAIRADEGQPIAFTSSPQTGTAVSIHSPVNGQLAFGQHVQIASGAVILGGPLSSTTITKLGDNVSVGAGAVVARSNVGDGSTIGARAYVANSTLPAGSVVPDGTILINNKNQGTIQW